MSSFGTCLITDSRIADLTPELTYAVEMGGAQVTAQQFAPTSATNSSVVFSIQVPSENIIIDRAITIGTQINFTIQIGSGAVPADIPAGQLAFNLGVTDALQAFPFNKLITTAQATINNCSVSTNEQDIIDAVLRLNNSRELYRYNSTTASLPDQAWATYYQSLGANNSPLESYNTASYDLDQVPRGAFPVTINNVAHYVAGVLTDNSLVSTATTDYWIIQLSTYVIEPLLTLSPFIWSNPEFNAQGITGINNLSFNFTIDSSCKRFWSTAYNGDGVYLNPPQAFPYQVSLGWNGGIAFSNMSMRFQFLSSQPTQLIASKNVCPYYDFPRYLTNFNGTAPIGGLSSGTIISNTIQINQIPDLFLIYARVPMSQQTPGNSATFFTINNVSVNFNNASGLLASFTSDQLWRISCEAGLNMSYNEWSGRQLINNVNGEGSIVSTTGSILVLNATNLSLPNYLAPGSLGNFQFQITMNVTNNYLYSVAPELVVVCCNSGLLVSEQGQSSTFTGILTKELVLSTAESPETPEISKASDSRMVGGKHLNRGLVRHMKHMHHHAHKRKHHTMHGGAVSGGGGGTGSSTAGGAMHHGMHHKHGHHKLHKLLR